MSFFKLISILSITLIVDGYNLGFQMKVWYPMTEFNRSSNWNPPRVPCEADHVHFSNDIEFLFTFGALNQTRLKSLNLPINGEIAMPFQGFIEFSQGSSSLQCPGEDIYFIGKSSEEWMDNKNWRPAQLHDEKYLDVKEQNLAIPHLERLPCQYDSVMILSYYRVGLPEISLSVGRIIISDYPRNVKQTINRNIDWSVYINSFASFNQFRTGKAYSREDALQINDYHCHDLQGCLCHPEKDLFFLKEVACAYEKCPLLILCNLPVQPEGHCCPICATVITLEINRNFIITKLKLFINLKLHPHEDHIDYYFSRVSRKKVQIILKDKEKYIGKSSEIGINLNAWIVHESSNLNIETVNLQLSGNPISLGSWQVRLMIPLGTLLLVLVSFGLLFLHTNQRFLIMINRWIPIAFDGENDTPPFIFARFVNVSANGEGECLTEEAGSNIEIAHSANDHEIDHENLQSFSNPLFSDLDASIPEIGPLNKDAEILNTGTARENPTYTEMTELDLINNE